VVLQCFTHAGAVSSARAALAHKSALISNFCIIWSYKITNTWFSSDDVLNTCLDWLCDVRRCSDVDSTTNWRLWPVVVRLLSWWHHRGNWCGLRGLPTEGRHSSRILYRDRVRMLSWRSDCGARSIWTRLSGRPVLRTYGSLAHLFSVNICLSLCVFVYVWVAVRLSAVWWPIVLVISTTTGSFLWSSDAHLLQRSAAPATAWRLNVKFSTFI